MTEIGSIGRGSALELMFPGCRMDATGAQQDGEGEMVCATRKQEGRDIEAGG
jgi:hypothetical protein